MSSGTGGNYPAPVVAGESAGVNQAFQPFPYPNTTQAANNAYSGIGGLVNTGGQSALNSTASSLLGEVGQLPGQTLPIGQNAIAAGQNVYNQGQNLYTQGQQQYTALAPYVTQALQAGFDPQNQLYNRNFNLQQQQNLASQAMSGVGQSPYAAGLTQQGNENFNIDWQNNQLARQAQGAQTAGALSSGAMNAANTGLNAAATGMGALSSGIGDYASMLGLMLSGQEGLTGAAGNALTQAQGLSQQQIADYLAYLSGSTQNAAAATSGQLGALNAGTGLYQATNAGNLANQQLTNSALGGLGGLGGSLLGNNLGGLGSLFNGSLSLAAGGGVL